MINLTEQYAEMAQKCGDLKVKHNNEVRNLKSNISDVHKQLKDAQEYGQKFKRKFDELNKSSKDEIQGLKIKIRVLEKSSNEAQEKFKDFEDLRSQVIKFKNQMQKYESIEKKLKDAIQKKKEELAKEKKLRKHSSKIDLNDLKVIEHNNKLEKNIRKLQKQVTDLTNENSIFKNRLSEMLKKDEYSTPQKLNQSLVVPLSCERTNHPGSSHGILMNEHKKMASHMKPKRTKDSRAVS